MLSSQFASHLNSTSSKLAAIISPDFESLPATFSYER
jgi:hypothetical protein